MYKEPQMLFKGTSIDRGEEVKWAVSHTVLLWAHWWRDTASFPASMCCSLVLGSSFFLVQAIAILTSFTMSLDSLRYLWRWGRCVSRWKCSHYGGTVRGPAPCRREVHLQIWPSTGRAAKRHLDTDMGTEDICGWERDAVWMGKWEWE